MTDTPDRLNRVRWRCRRGMKELDVLLERFTARGLHRLSNDEMEELERLLELPDDVLLACLSGNLNAPDPSLRSIARKVRTVSAGPA